MRKIKHLQYIHLPYSVLKDDSLIHNEKLVLSNIISVITGGGQYRFDNSFIADYLNSSTRTASRIISLLVSKDIIRSEYKYKPGSKEIQHRVLSLTSRGMERYVVGVTSQRSRGPIDTDGAVILKPSNTISNTKSIIKDNTYDFDSFWNKYNKKIDRGGCLSKWRSLTQSARDQILNNLSRFISQFEDPQYMMHPKTFLNYVKRNPEDWVNEIIEMSDSNGGETIYTAEQLKKWGLV
tara:strand:+ start:11401 stop:12111 length:711 start_codon:yes stop_codon:yes gene_type:complete